MSKLIKLLQEISDKLDALAPALLEQREQEKKCALITRHSAAKIAKVHPNTIANWAKEFSGLSVGCNQYNLAKLKEIMRLKGRN